MKSVRVLGLFVTLGIFYIAATHAAQPDPIGLGIPLTTISFCGTYIREYGLCDPGGSDQSGLIWEQFDFGFNG